MITGRIVIYKTHLTYLTLPKRLIVLIKNRRFQEDMFSLRFSVIGYTVCFSVLVTVYVVILWCLAHISFDLLFCKYP